MKRDRPLLPINSSIAAAAGLPASSFILDGEAVVLDELGASDFGALQRALGGRGGRLKADLASLYAFDLLYLDGHDLRSMPLEDRRVLPADFLDGHDAAIRLREEIEGSGAAFLKQACTMGLEGIIAKRARGARRPWRATASGSPEPRSCLRRRCRNRLRLCRRDGAPQGDGRDHHP
jgi:bifunctional non-homologous end joining protein LigD